MKFRMGLKGKMLCLFFKISAYIKWEGSIAGKKCNDRRCRLDCKICSEYENSTKYRIRIANFGPTKITPGFLLGKSRVGSITICESNQ